MGNMLAKISWAKVRLQISVGNFPWVNVCGQMSRGIFIRSMSVGKRPWVNICGKISWLIFLPTGKSPKDKKFRSKVPSAFLPYTRLVVIVKSQIPLAVDNGTCEIPAQNVKYYYRYVRDLQATGFRIRKNSRETYREKVASFPEDSQGS